MNGVVVVDASLAFKWLVEEADSDKAHAILLSWEDRGVRPAAPRLMPFEIANALHRRVAMGELTLETAADLMENMLSSQLELHETPNLHRRAFELASQLRQRAVYDAHYLALAESFDCEMWTADERFFRAARRVADNVRWIGQFATAE